MLQHKFQSAQKCSKTLAPLLLLADVDPCLNRTKGPTSTRSVGELPGLVPSQGGTGYSPRALSSASPIALQPTTSNSAVAMSPVR